MRKLIILLSLGMLGLAPAAAVGCSAADPGVGNLIPRHSTGNPSSASDDAGVVAAPNPAPTTPTPTPTSTPTPTPSADAGTSAPADAGATPGAGGEGGTTGNFLGETTAYASAPVATSARTNHANHGQAAQQPTTDCLGCHGPNATVPFLAAGWVATTANGTTGAADVEVRVFATGAAAAFSAHTDTDGFFWINPPASGATGPYQAGARNATATNLMTAQQSTGDCQSCHAAAQGPIHVP
jgi:hypothetical protein